MSKINKTAKILQRSMVYTLIVLLKSLKWILILGIVGCFFVAGAGIGYVAALVKDEPIRDRETILARMQENTETSFVYFSDGSLVGQLRTEADRRMVEMHEIPQHVIDALLAVEDDNFFHHIGIDFSGLMRAVKQRVFNEPIQTGGSTITQQVARNVFLGTARQDSRKAREIFLAMRIERYMSKEEILLAYLNKVPFGNGSSGYNVYGIKAAAEGIFGIENLHDLHLAQAAYLVGLPQSPSAYSAFTGTGEFNERGFERAMERQRHVLNRMLKEGRITEKEYEEALKFDVRATLAEPKPKAYTTYPYLMLEIERRAAEVLALLQNPKLEPEDLKKPEYASLMDEAMHELLNGGYHIYTTIDKEMYDAMREIAQNPDLFTPDDEEKGVEQIGAIMLDNKTGAILSMIEGRDFHIEQLNHATQMVRQPGSTMKPLAAFLPALESGAIQPATPIDDIPIVLPDGGARGYHIAQNWDLRYHGLMTARRALNQSYNIPALKLFNEVVGIENAWEFVRKLGITTLTEEDNYAYTGVIGGLKYGTSVEELTNAFRSIPNKGKINRAYMISRIEDSDGNIVYEHQPMPETVYSEQTAYLMTDMLRTVITSGTGTSIQRTFKHYGQVAIAGKTGSTQQDRDAWFIGFTPDIIVGVWAGYDQNHTLTLRSSLPQGPGTQRAKNIWSVIMDTAMELKPEWFPNKEFEQPEGIVRMTVSAISGKLPSEHVRATGELVTDLFNRKYVPTEVDDHLTFVQYVHYNGRNYLPLPTTPKDMVMEKLLIKREEPIYDILADIEEKLKNTPLELRQKKNGRPVTLQDYIPEDLDRTAPQEVDPRKDDGHTPPPPTGLELVELEGRYKITFQPSSSENVVGYRLYRSLNGGPFEHRPNQNVLTGQEPVVYDYFSPQHHYAYYLTAVDIMGRESEPSVIVQSGGGAVPQQPDDAGDEEDPDADGTSEDRDRPQGSPVTSAPSAPQNVRVSKQESGLAIEISWKANPKSEQVTHYDIYYSNAADGDYRKIGTSDTNSFKYIAIPAEGWYRVVAVNAQGSSPPSQAVELKESE